VGATETGGKARVWGYVARWRVRVACATGASGEQVRVPSAIMRVPSAVSAKRGRAARTWLASRGAVRGESAGGARMGPTRYPRLDPARRGRMV